MQRAGVRFLNMCAGWTCIMFSGGILTVAVSSCRVHSLKDDLDSRLSFINEITLQKVYENIRRG